MRVVGCEPFWSRFARIPLPPTPTRLWVLFSAWPDVEKLFTRAQYFAVKNVDQLGSIVLLHFLICPLWCELYNVLKGMLNPQDQFVLQIRINSIFLWFSGAAFMKELKSGLRLKSETLGSNVVNILLSL